MSSTGDPNAKVLFRVPGEGDRAHVETLWAFDLGGDRYRLDNSPFYAYGVSLGDTVLAPHDRDEGFPTFKGVVSKSGNRTVRVAFDSPVQAGSSSDHVLQDLVRLGCDYEGANRRYIVVNVPAAVDLSAVVKCLVDCNAEWEHADPTYEELHPDDT